MSSETGKVQEEEIPGPRVPDTDYGDKRITECVPDRVSSTSLPRPIYLLTDDRRVEGRTLTTYRPSSGPSLSSVLPTHPSRPSRERVGVHPRVGPRPRHDHGGEGEVVPKDSTTERMKERVPLGLSLLHDPTSYRPPSP